MNLPENGGHFDIEEVGQYCRDLVDGQLSQDDFQRLSKLLVESVQAREYFLRYVDLNSSLASLLKQREMDGAGSSFAGSTFGWESNGVPKEGDLLGLAGKVTVRPLETPSKNLFRFAIVASLLFVLGGAIIWFGNSMKNRQQVAGDPDPVKKNTPVGKTTHGLKESQAGNQSDGGQKETPVEDTMMAANEANGSKPWYRPLPVGEVEEDVAVVVLANDVPVEQLKVGKRLKPGVLFLSRGALQIEFMGGAILALEGPAEIQLDNKDAAFLLSGSLRAFVPPRAKGFRLTTPDSALVDLGTEFGIEVDAAGVSDVSVLTGEVEISLLDEEGHSRISRRLKESGRVQINRETQSIEYLEQVNESLPSIVEIESVALDVPESYVRSVLDFEPLHYWRFSQLGDLVGDETGSNTMLEVNGDGSSLTISGGQANFLRSEEGRYLKTTEPLRNFNRDEFSYEMWINPSDLQHSSCFSVYPVRSEDAFEHLNVIELVTDTFLAHEPGSFRFLHRSPPSRHSTNDQNLFTRGLCTSGQWHHVVATKTKDTLEIFLNGELMRRAEMPIEERDGEFHIMVGQLRIGDFIRQFAGAMDEVAIYDRRLSEDEVRKHYALMFKS